MAQNFGRGNGIGSILRQTGREEGCRRTANVIRYGAKSRCRHRFCYGRDGSLVWLLLLLHKPEMTLRQIIYRDFLINIHHYLDWGSRKWVLTYIWASTRCWGWKWMGVYVGIRQGTCMQIAIGPRSPVSKLFYWLGIIAILQAP